MRCKRFSTVIFSVLIALICYTNYSPADNAHYLTIIHTNDVHGRLKPIDYGIRHDVGGFAARANLIQQFKSQNKNVLVLDAGDIAQGTLFFKFLGF